MHFDRHFQKALFILLLLLAIGFIGCGDDDGGDSDDDRYDNGYDNDDDDDDDDDNNGSDNTIDADGDQSENAEDTPFADGDEPPFADGDEPPLADGDEPPLVDGDEDTAAEEEIEYDWTPGNRTCDSMGYTLTDGVNMNFPALDRNDRQFTLVLPSDIDTHPGPWPVVFFWYGSGDNMANFVRATGVESLVDNADMPFIGVVPKSVPIWPTEGYDWHVLMYNEGANHDIAIYDNIMACLSEVFVLDEERIFATGFSAGGMMTSMLSIVRGEELAAVAPYSGVYFSDPVQEECIMGICASWPAYDLSNKFPAMLTWGGPSDVFTVMAGFNLDFNQHNLDSINFLTANGHDVIACPHGLGHTIPFSIGFSKVIDFFKRHPKGTVNSPYATEGLPTSFPDYCTFHPKQ